MDYLHYKVYLYTSLLTVCIAILCFFAAPLGLSYVQYEELRKGGNRAVARQRATLAQAILQTLAVGSAGLGVVFFLAFIVWYMHPNGGNGADNIWQRPAASASARGLSSWSA